MTTTWQTIAGATCRPVYGFHDLEEGFVWSTYAFGLFFPLDGAAGGVPVLKVHNPHGELTISCRVGGRSLATTVPHGELQIQLDADFAGRLVDFSISPKVLLGSDVRELGLLFRRIGWDAKPDPSSCQLLPCRSSPTGGGDEPDALDQLREAAKTLGNRVVGSFLREGWVTIDWVDGAIRLQLHAPLWMRLGDTMKCPCLINEREVDVTFVRDRNQRNLYRGWLQLREVLGRSAALLDVQEPIDVELQPSPIGRFRGQSANWRGCGSDELPDLTNMMRVAGRVSFESFLLHGASWFVKLDRLASQLLPDGIAGAQRIVDWGCGCARISRHVPEEHRAKFIGFDIDSVNIAWCKEHVRGMRFEHCSVEPPLPLEANSVDILFAHSVFTHLAEDRQDRWLEEIRRVLRPGGLAFVTVLSELSWYARFWPTGRTPEAIAQYLAAGFVDQGWQQDVGVDMDCPGAYVQVSHGQEYVSSKWSRLFEVLDWIDGFAGMLTLVILRK